MIVLIFYIYRNENLIILFILDTKETIRETGKYFNNS